MITVDEIERINKSGSWKYIFHTDELYWSEGSKRLFQTSTPKGFAGFLDLIHPDDISFFLEERDYEKVKEFQVIFRLNPDKYSEERIFLNRITTVEDRRGQVIGLKGVTTNVTTELEMKGLYQSIFNLSTTGNVLLKTSGELLDCNTEFERIVGKKREHLRGGHIFELIHPKERQRALLKYYKHQDANTRKVIRYDTRLVNQRTQNPVHVSLQSARIPNTNMVLVSILDITQVIWQRNLFQTVFELPNIGNMIVRKDLRLLQCNHECERITGYSEEEMREMSPEELITPASMTVFKHLFAPAELREGIQPEVQIVRKDGQLIWVQLHAEPIPHTEWFFTTIQDVTQSKVHKETLLENIQERNNFRDALNGAALVSITDLKGKIIYANEQFMQVSGYDMDELVGQTHRLLNSGEYSEMFWTDMWKTIKNGSPWRAEVKNKAKNGAYYWVDTTINPVRNKDGKVYQYMSVRYLITRRKELEEQQQRLLEDLEEYTFLTSHKMRGPLARVLGLVQIIDQEMALDQLKEVIRMLQVAAEELDQITVEMNKVLNQTAYERIQRKRKKEAASIR